MSAVAEARAHLGAALSQSIPSDDQIIINHMREAHALLRTVDARLVDAAPDMLAALKEAHRALMHYEWYDNPKSDWALPENKTLRGQIERATAKATQS